MVTVAIMAVLAGASVPVFHTHLRGSTLRAGAEEFVSLVNVARSLAIKDGARVCIARDASSNRVRLLIGSSTPCTTFTKTYGIQGHGVDFRADASGWITLQNQVAVTAATADVIFTPLGFATPGGTYTISKLGHSLSVVVAPSGRVSVAP
jgi:Tfp pilus assembly protein FimT